ncbi:hypothetical protein Pcinc_043717 [Petrolisthes cinctipes]|uniref:Uncharacterized protein n=1 Tax=Petrolisthes cinctipes TaxID=88211 RepID=A0AAE1EHL7_PETCI|nr:hypothetical protein Pcinc_043717 [Petrolisthes cinctipes]
MDSNYFLRLDGTMDERCGVVQVSSAPPRPASLAAATKAPPPHHRGLATLGPQVVLTGTSTSNLFLPESQITHDLDYGRQCLTTTTLAKTEVVMRLLEALWVVA